MCVCALLSFFSGIHSPTHEEETIFCFFFFLFWSFSCLQTFKKRRRREKKTTSDRVTVISGRRTHSDDPLPRCDEISIGECLSLSLISVNFSMFLSLNAQLSCQWWSSSFLLYLNLEECNRQIFFLFAKSDEKEKNLIMWKIFDHNDSYVSVSPWWLYGECTRIDETFVDWNMSSYF